MPHSSTPLPLFTSDGPTDVMLTGGTLTGAWATVNFGSRATEGFEALKRHRPLDQAESQPFGGEGAEENQRQLPRDIEQLMIG